MIFLNQVNKYYENHHVLKNISIEIKPKTTTVICGPSGSGKSTLIRVIAGLEVYQSGAVKVLGQTYNSLYPGIFDGRVGMVFQQFNLFERLTVLDNLILAPIKRMGLSKTEARNRARAMLSRIGLIGHEDKLPHQLSGGEQQRVAMIRAILNKPELLLFDEPTSSLDPEMIHDVLSLMTELVQDDLTAVVVTHEMGFAKAVADEVIFMDKGEIIEKNCPNNFFASPKSERAQDFLKRILSHV